MIKKQGTAENQGVKVLAIILIILIVIVAVLIILKIFGTNDDNIITNELAVNEQEEPEEVTVATTKTLSGTSRPIAIMIDNNINALPQAGLNDAAIVYEIIVEGGESRLMLILQDVDLDKIGPIRSARHYFLDYALENDAIYVHYGWSPQAQSDISTLGVDYINGIYESSTSFWRVTEKYTPHNVVTSTENIMSIAEREGYRTQTNQDTVLNYVVSEVNLEDGSTATDVVIPYSDSNVVEFLYDEAIKEYVRYSRGEKQVDWNTGEDVTTKNIIIEFAQNTTIEDGSGKGRQTISNITTLNGYYITNGKAIPITCTKTSRSSQTVYKDLEGNEIDVNDGNTFIEICPIDAEVTFVENTESN